MTKTKSPLEFHNLQITGTEKQKSTPDFFNLQIDETISQESNFSDELPIEDIIGVEIKSFTIRPDNGKIADIVFSVVNFFGSPLTIAEASWSKNGVDFFPMTPLASDLLHVSEPFTAAGNFEEFNFVWQVFFDLTKGFQPGVTIKIRITE